MMQAYTEEQRKALIEHCEAILSQFNADSFKFPKTQAVYEIALAALTAEPAASTSDFYMRELQNKKSVNGWLVKPGSDPGFTVALYTAPPVAAPAVPDGWKLVPIIAFPSQWAAGQKAFESAGMNKVDAVYRAMVAAAPEVRALQRCAAARDGECNHAQCPQLRDGEPENSGRHCPIDNWDEDD